MAESHNRCICGNQLLFQSLREQNARIFLLSNAQACFTEGELRGLGLADAFRNEDLPCIISTPFDLNGLIPKYHDEEVLEKINELKAKLE